MANAMELLKLTPEDEATRFCHWAGWHHNGDTSAMLGNGGIVQLPEVMVAFSKHIMDERDRLMDLLKESLATALPNAVVVTKDTTAGASGTGPAQDKVVDRLRSEE